METNDMNAINYSEYTVPISSECSYYGSECTEEDAARIAASIGRMVQSEFPGVQIEIRPEFINGNVRGPNAQVCEDIGQFIADNWTKAL